MTQVKILENLIRKQAKDIAIIQTANIQKDQTVAELTQRLATAEAKITKAEQDIQKLSVNGAKI